jgi:hypothetical protein
LTISFSDAIDGMVPEPPSVFRVAQRARGNAVHDHIIVGRDGHASLKGLRLI